MAKPVNLFDCVFALEQLTCESIILKDCVNACERVVYLYGNIELCERLVARTLLDVPVVIDIPGQ